MSRRKKRMRPARGTLVAISILLLGSVVIRVSSNAGQAFARAAQPAVASSSMQHPANCEPSEDLGAVLAAFQERETHISAREEQIKSRMQALLVADRKIEEKMAALEAAEAQLKDTLALADGAAENDLSKLTSVYESMKPKDASALFEQMAPEFSAGFLGRMKPASAAAILAGLSAERAYTISVILAGRNANVPKE
ncbi:hypothetical protein KO498_05135 [Lentibacter algarum]|uniref:MotE family protein n=1 Tax=Lentibacter algarum TaxID=576131 RepID=UPI001C06FC0F|nr:hypothetical protein [Lentibacter algarum]MBU2981190.1 hypothetical protein [Lentibacter algarum]